MKLLVKIVAFICVPVILTTSSPAIAGEAGDAKSILIAGAGPSTKVVELLAKEFPAAHEGYEITVPPKSIKHKGGLKWVAVQGMLFGRTGRPLSDKNKQTYPQLRELPVAKVKLAFAVKKDIGVTKLTQDQLKGIYAGTIKNWKEVGGIDQGIILLGRKPGESVLGALIKDYPFFASAPFSKIYDKEHQIVKAIGNVPGSIGFSAKANLTSQKNYTVLSIEGFSSGLMVGLVYDVKNEDAKTVKSIKSFVHSDRWLKALEANDFLALKSG